MRNIKCKNTSPAFTSVQPNHFLGINTTYVFSLTNVYLRSETYAWNLYLLIFSKKHTQEETTTTKQEQNAEKMKYLALVFLDVWLIMLQYFFLEPPSNFVNNLPLVSLGLF